MNMCGLCLRKSVTESPLLYTAMAFSSVNLDHLVERLFAIGAPKAACRYSMSVPNIREQSYEYSEA